MEFTVSPRAWDQQFELIYRREEYSMASVPHPDNCISSVVVNDLELEVDCDGVVVCVSGLCPHPGWQPTERTCPSAMRQTLVVVGEAWVPGISKRLTAPYGWSMHVNRRCGCVCIGDPEARGVAAEFAPGSVAVLDGPELVAIWLTPKTLPSP